MKKLGPGIIHQLVLGHPGHGLAETGDTLDHALGLLAPLGGVEQHQLAHPGHAVVAADDAHHLGRPARNRLGVEQAVGPHSTAAVKRHLGRAVRVHGHQPAGIGVDQIGVFPALVEDPAIVHHRRAPVVFLVETQLAHVLPVRGQAIKIRHRIAAVDAGHRHHRRRGSKQDVAPGQVARGVVVHIRPQVRSHLATAGAIGGDLVDLPGALGIGLGEHQFSRIGMQLHIADKGSVRWLVEGGKRAVRGHWGQHGELVVVADLGQGAVALPVLGQAQGRGFLGTADQQQLGEIHQGVRQQGLPLELQPGRGLILSNGGVLLQFNPSRCDLTQGIQAGAERRRGIGGEGRAQVVDGPTQGLGIQQGQLADYRVPRSFGRFFVRIFRDFARGGRLRRSFHPREV